MEEKKQLPVTWLWGLFYVHLVGCLLSVFALLDTVMPFSVGGWYTWAQRAVSLGIVVCLYLLSGRYRLAGMARTLGLLCSLLPLGLHTLLQMNVQTYAALSTVLSRASLVLTLIALFLEYTAHAAAVPADKRKWYILLACSLAATLVSSVAIALLQPLVSNMAQEDLLRFSGRWNGLSRSLSLGTSVVYLALLRRGIDTQRKE